MGLTRSSYTQTCTAENSVLVYEDGNTVTEDWDGCETVFDPLSDFTSSGGYIQTPGWNPEDYRSFPTRMDSWVNITVPQDHAVMISFYFLQLNYNFYSGCGDQVEIFTGGNFTEDELISAAPEKLASGKWNCSVPHWSDFDLHLLCNLETECAAGEDEAACPYTDTAWGHLASLNSEEEWRGFDEVIMNRKRGACVSQAQWCDGQPHCVDGSDEVHCDRWDLQYDVHNPPPPAVVDFDGRGSFTDDELVCGVECPENCTCHGLAFFCADRFDVGLYEELRYLDASGTGMDLALKLLDLSGVRIDVLDSSVFTPFENLEIMNLSNSGVDNVLEAGFKMLGRLTELDLRGCPVAEFPKDVFGGLDRLQTVDSDNYKLCCPATLPVGFNLQNCRAPSDGISSCDALLGSTSYRVFTAVGASLALTGNLGSFVLRVLVRRSGLATTYGVFVTHLSVSDFLMGVYLTIIGVADSMYKGSYLWEDTIWRSSAACQVAGFFFMLSNEVSLFLIALITLDRVLVLHAPNYSRLHFHKMSAQVTCALVWILGLLLAVVPLAVTSWEVYGQTGICVPLPFPRNDFAGEGYAFGVVVVFTFILSVLITVGQAFVNASIRKSNVIATEKSKLDLQRDIARRLVPVTMVDCLCWFAVSLFGILASSGTPIPVEVGADMAVFILPLHSAINPILYMFGVLMERRQKAWEERLMKLVAAKVKASEAKAKVSRGLSSRSTTSRKTDG
nr:hypothetical protein BaRGS_028816 [Batillaria attramentaria]